jgi:hypothetical protein
MIQPAGKRFLARRGYSSVWTVVGTPAWQALAGTNLQPTWCEPAQIMSIAT